LLALPPLSDNEPPDVPDPAITSTEPPDASANVNELAPPLTTILPALAPELLPDDTSTEPDDPDSADPDTKLSAPLEPVEDVVAIVTAPVVPELLEPLLINTDPPSPDSD